MKYFLYFEQKVHVVGTKWVCVDGRIITWYKEMPIQSEISTTIHMLEYSTGMF